MASTQNDEQIIQWIREFLIAKGYSDDSAAYQEIQGELPRLYNYLMDKLLLSQEEGQSTKKSETTTNAGHEQVVQWLVGCFNAPEYQQRLERLYQDRGSQDTEEWARLFYEEFRDNPCDERLIKLNNDRRELLLLIYKMVDLWEETGFSQDFEAAIDSIFTTQRLLLVLMLCLPMDRAQATIKMRHPTTAQSGLHWFSFLHLDPQSCYDPTKREDLRNALDGYMGSPTMNFRLFRLCYSPILGLSKIPVIDRWCQPVLVTHFVKHSFARGAV